MDSGRLWWVKRGGEPKGPFPAAVLENNITQGRIRPDDQLSRDREQWFPAGQYPDFDLLVKAGSGQAWARQLDERKAARRAETEGDAAGARSGVERRAPEDADAVARRERSNRVWASLRDKPEARGVRWLPFVLVGVLMAGIFGLATQGTRSDADTTHCAAAPAAGVNWESCTLTDRSLRGTNLVGANLKNAKLVGVDLSDARLDGADLAYADLSGANLQGSRLAAARLTGARLVAATLTGVTLTGADLRFAELTNATFDGARLAGALFEDTLLPTGQPCTDPSGQAGCFKLIPGIVP